METIKFEDFILQLKQRYKNASSLEEKVELAKICHDCYQEISDFFDYVKSDMRKTATLTKQENNCVILASTQGNCTVTFSKTKYSLKKQFENLDCFLTSEEILTFFVKKVKYQPRSDLEEILSEVDSPTKNKILALLEMKKSKPQVSFKK